MSSATAALACLSLAATITAGEITERPELDRHFQAHGVDGAILLQHANSGERLTNDPARLDHGYLPASTFKVINSLIGLEEGAFASVDEVLEWDGVDRGGRAWNRDQTMRSAIRVSAVWYYQELARRVGRERVQHWIDAVGYGNRDIGGGIDRFWLDGAIRITPRQQIEFLERLYRRELPFSAATMEAVIEIMERDRGDGWVLRAKTGWATAPDPDIGWWVGWVERGDDVWFFATQIDLIDGKDAKARQALTDAALIELGVLPNSGD